ncbi:haloacid dehalogenase [Sphaerobacter thermophilus]|uniref:Translin n=1 Tax=Sphaerobacter thermophilus (strain ATCC 49802 / DSM 20745 / KCCM 41009 / NCIMB 13125 / S 6022) TaxID=479434 RepID=D1C263_SPHTD|nr:haloacid dehalogenase [Sphaerobacter thermophilus]ACZ38330.1 Translin [Sphaerobacter thermophilus DSM 20745]PZN62380.1 MAG: haloacid dehalogenase [Sphaerobacter thermophilus]
MEIDINRIASIGEAVIVRLEGINAARERALAESRQIIRLSANAVRAVHRNEFDVAEELLRQAQELKDALVSHLADYPSIYWSGYVQDAHKEYAEARITLGVIGGRAIPDPAQLGVEDAVYLNGLGEAAGEFRRYCLDAMRRGDLSRAEALLQVMDEIYGLLVSVDYPDAVTGGLRRTTDMVRGVLERTRGDLTLALQQQALTEALGRAETLLREQQRDREGA